MVTTHKNQQHIFFLLLQAYKISDRQREEFRSTLEQLRYQLQRTESERDTALHAQKREHSGQDSLTRRLQQTVEQLESTNRAQEQVYIFSYVILRILNYARRI